MIECPSCRRETHLEGGATGPASLRVNLTIQRLITVLAENERHKANPTKLTKHSIVSPASPCENCDTLNPETATTGCLDCGQVFCNNCSKQIHSMQAFKGHSVIPIHEYESALQEAKEAEAMALLSKCRTHPSNDVAFSCNQVSHICR